MNSSDTSRGSAPKIACIAAAASAFVLGVIAFVSSQVWSVSLSQLPAWSAFQGAVTSICEAIRSSSSTTATTSPASGSGGAVPSGPVSL